MISNRLTYLTENIHKLHLRDRVVSYFLYDSYRETIARIDGVLVEESTGRVRYIVITQGGALGLRGKRTLVPRDAYEVIDMGEVKTAWSGQYLMDIPVPNDINDITLDEERKILSYFNLRPYWDDKPLKKSKT